MKRRHLKKTRRLLKKAASGAAGLLGGLALASSANARDVQNFKPTVGDWNLFSVQTAQTAPEGFLAPSLVVSYGRDPVSQQAPNGLVLTSVVEHLTTAHVMAAYGVTDRFDLAVELPLGFTDGDGIDGLNGGGALGDVRLSGKYRLLGHRRHGLALSFDLTAPTGDADRGMSADTFVALPRVVGHTRVGPVMLAANVGYRYRAEDTQLSNLSFGDEIAYGAGASVPLGRSDLQALAEVYGSIPVEDTDFPSTQRPVETMGGLRYTGLGNWAITAGAGTGLVQDYGAPDVRLMSGLTWQPSAEPERAPPMLASNTNMIVGDVEDLCPGEPEDEDGHQDEDGCPDPDNDADGIPDVQDLCPDTPEDKDGFLDRDGCPELDNDDDGIADADDQCPLAAETDAEIEGADGCPEAPKSRVTLVDDKLKAGRVFFARDKATIKVESLFVLDGVAAYLAARPEIKRVLVEGHTDARGLPRYNRKLSQARADAVRAYLIEQGVDADRLEARGFGEARPVQQPGTEGAAEKNRRVEFTILK